MYQQGTLTHFASFSPKRYLAAAGESESAKQELHTTLLYSTCSTSRITQACVFTPHPYVMMYTLML